MNLIPLAALLIACLALAVAITSLVTVERIRRRIPIRRQHQVSGHGSVQVQTGGSIHLSDITTTSDPAVAAILARQEAERMGRHL